MQPRTEFILGCLEEHNLRSWLAVDKGLRFCGLMAIITSATPHFERVSFPAPNLLGII
jgi:hypothetical protein